MSLILEALNRADRDRNSENNSPILQAQPHFSNQRSGLSYLRLIEITLVVIMVIFVGYKLLSNHDNDTGLTVKAEAEKTAAIETTQSSQPQPKITDNEAASFEPNPAVQSLYEKTKATAKVATEVHSTTPQAIIEPPTTKAIAVNIPYLEELNASIQKNIPSVDYNQHMFLDDDNSFIEINEQLLKAGQTITNGIRLISISEEFIILSHQGIEFKLKALNSWVNFN